MVYSRQYNWSFLKYVFRRLIRKRLGVEKAYPSVGPRYEVISSPDLDLYLVVPTEIHALSCEIYSADQKLRATEFETKLVLWDK